jgi:hypothetical protein
MNNTVIVKQELSILVSSDQNAGAINLRDQGSRFDVYYENDIVIPVDSTNINVGLSEASIWNSVPNMSTFLENNHVLITIAGTPIDCIVEDGLYTPSELSDALNFIIRNVNPNYAGYLTLSSDFSTNKVLLNFNAPVLMTFDLTVSNDMSEILGLNPAVYTNSGNILSIRAPEIAVFNNVNTFLLHSNIVSSGMTYNGSNSQILCAIPILASPGELIIYQPTNPTLIQEPYMNGRSINSLSFWLTDEDNNVVQMNEVFIVRVKISYDIIKILK